MRIALLVLFVAFPAMAYTPQELLSARTIAHDCKGEVCAISQRDLAWMVARDELMTRLVDQLYEKASACPSARTT